MRENMNKENEVIENLSRKKWYQKVPNAFVILFFILLLASVLTYTVPSGEFQREMMDNGRMGVVPGSFGYIEKTSEMTVSLWDLLKAIPVGMVQASGIIMIVFLAGGMFKILGATGVIENSIGILIKKIEEKNISKHMALAILTFVFGFFGAAIGYESLMPFVPLGCMVALGLGYDLIVGAGIVIGGLSVGFATSPINPYTVGVSHAIANLPTFSGMGLRTAYCSTALVVMAHHIIRYAKRIEKDPSRCIVKGISTEGLEIDKTKLNSYHLDSKGKLILGIFLSFILAVVVGVIKFKFYLTEISALFVLYAIVIGLVARFDSDKIVNTFINGAAELIGGALIVGFARAIQVILSQGRIGDTIIYNLSAPLQNFQPAVSAIFMTLIQGVINFFIPSGSGQAMATMPIIIPISDLIGVNRQIAVLAFQIGDGLINMLIPTLGTLMAMLALARVPFNKWIRFIAALVAKLYVVGWIFLWVATIINWQ